MKVCQIRTKAETVFGEMFCLAAKMLFFRLRKLIRKGMHNGQFLTDRNQGENKGVRKGLAE